MTVTLESLKKSVGRKSAKSEIFAWIADLERAAGDLDGALQRVDGGLTLYPNDVAAMVVRAKILFQQEKFEECVQQCEKILVKDTFNLAGQKIMGDAYDKLGKVPERNVCYRRYHDMDPLNTFWKEEYDVVEAAVAAAVAADMTMSDEDFSMPEESGLFIKTLEEQNPVSASGIGDDGSSVESSFEKAFGDTFGSSDDSNEDDGGLFEKSASSIGLSLDDENKSSDTASPFSKGFDDPQEDESLESSLNGAFSNALGGAFEETSSQVEDDNDDPFAALAAMLPNSDAAEDSMMEDLSASLDATMETISAEDSADKPLEEFPADDNISGTDVNSAMSSFFGLDDDLEAEETTSASSSFEETLVDENASANASVVFGAAAEDKPMSVDNAFDSIFGEDELPEEQPQEIAAPAEDKPMSVDNAFDSIFGDDELPEEKPLELPAEEDAKLDGEWSPSPVAEEPAVEEKPATPPPEEGLSVSNAFDSIFGGDEDLPEEKPQTTVEESLELPAEEDVKLDGEWSPSPVAAEPAATEELVVEEKPAAPASEEGLSVSSAFDSIFGDDEDLPEEKPQTAVEESLELPSEESSLELPAEESLELPAEETAMVGEVETPSAPAITSAMDFVLDDEPAAEESAPSAPASEESFAVDSAFSSIFGDDDDLPEEKPVEPAVEDVPSETISLAEQVDKAEAELELPSIQKEDSSDLAQEMGGAFASMFGDQDDLDLPELNAGENKVMFAAEDDQQATGAAFEEASENKLESDLDKSFSSLFGDDDDLSATSEKATGLAAESAEESPAMQNLDSLESEVSGAFKGLFDMDDDSLSLDQDKPSNSGVDFLMSGDSDDEVSAGLISNPDAPLNRGAQEIDESLNTKTLAEIYFDQGLYGKALDIYKDLALKEPENQEIANRMAEVEKLYREKFGGNG